MGAFFFVWSGLLFYIGQSAGAECPFVMTPSRVVVEYGGAFTVNCSSTTDEVKGMGWESTYKGTGLILEPHVQLKVDKVDRWEIESQCYLNFKNTSQCISDLPITIYKRPDSVILVSENKAMEEHKEYELPCKVSNVAPVNSITVTWYKGGSKIKEEQLSSTSRSTENVQSSSSVIKITADKRDHGNELTCEAKFDFGPTGPDLPAVKSSPLNLHVLYQPVFEEQVESVVVPTDGKITLDCTAQGNPTPNYQWQVLTEQKVGRKAVLDLEGPFPGTYNCTASNSQGSAIKQFVLTDAARDYTVLAAVVGVLAVLGLLLLISGPFIVTKDGTFSLNKGGYSKGQPSQPI